MRIKKTDITWALLLPLFIFFGCSDNEQLIPGEDTLRIISEIAGESKTRVSENQFEPNDEIGFYIIPFQPGNTIPGSFPGSAYIENKNLVYNGTIWYAASGEELSWPGNRKSDIYSYYPYNESANFLENEQYSFDIQTNQQTEEEYKKSDFLYAKLKSRDPIKNITLSFLHRMSKINVNIKSEVIDLSRTSDLTSVSLNHLFASAFIDMTQGHVLPDEDKVKTEIMLKQYGLAETNFDVSFTGIIVPQTIEPGTPLIKITNNRINYYYNITEKLNLESGNTYTFNINITNQGIEVSTTTIDEWKEGGFVDGTIGEPAPRIFDLNSLDWTKSLVHNIYDKNIVIGQVAKEYLFINNGNSDAQAIVVYPIGEGGKVDLTQGFVAQVMNRSRNIITNEYEPNTSGIHGGKANFDAATNSLTSYTPGTSVLLSKVEFTASGQWAGAASNAIPLLTSAPSVLTDVDGNEYSLVKIGTQYWMAENFKSEHYSNGSNILYYYYNNNTAYKETLGALYEWNTVMDSKGIAPEGWRVPSSNDWTSLSSYLYPQAGRKLKANIMWSNLNNNDNITGFSGLPGGRRTGGGTFNEINNYGQWWTSNSTSNSNANRLYLDFGNNSMHHTALNKSYTQSLRLMRN